MPKAEIVIIRKLTPKATGVFTPASWNCRRSFAVPGMRVWRRGRRLTTFGGSSIRRGGLLKSKARANWRGPCNRAMFPLAIQATAPVCGCLCFRRPPRSSLELFHCRGCGGAPPPAPPPPRGPRYPSGAPCPPNPPVPRNPEKAPPSNAVPMGEFSNCSRCSGLSVGATLASALARNTVISD